MQVRHDDIDSVGHVGHKSYFSFLQEARLDYLGRVGAFRRDGMEIEYLVARIEIDYLAPLFYGNTVEVRTRCTRIGRKSLTLSSDIVRTSGAAASDDGSTVEDETVSARAVVVMVRVDAETGSSCEHDPATMNAIRASQP